MKIYISFFIIALSSVVLFVGCTDMYPGIEQVKTHDGNPDKIRVDEVIAMSGSLEIKFTLPKGNPNIAQVVASYINKRGEKMEFKVSRYSSSIVVEGFTGTDEVTVKLVCVDSSGNESDVSIIQATPLLSPVEVAFNTMKVNTAFGGVRIDWENASSQPFAIHVLTQDTLQIGVASLTEDPRQTIYNRDSVNTFAYIRQYAPVEQQFGFVLSDKWGNRTDTLINMITPQREEKIDPQLVKSVEYFNPTVNKGNLAYEDYGIDETTGIQNDGTFHATKNNPKSLIDGVKTTKNYYAYKFVKNLKDPNPANRIQVPDVYVTFDLNVNVRLNRVKLYPRVDSPSYIYGGASVKRFRIWGTNHANNERWAKFPETWTLIGEYVGKDPVSPDNLTPEEIEYFMENQEFSIIDDNIAPNASPTEVFRYMRLQWIESYLPSSTHYAMEEFEMYGETIQ